MQAHEKARQRLMRVLDEAADKCAADSEDGNYSPSKLLRTFVDELAKRLSPIFEEEG